jgi:hypothetical protein
MAEMHNNKTAISFQARPRYKSLAALLTAIDRIILKMKIGVPMKIRRIELPMLSSTIVCVLA